MQTPRKTALLTALTALVLPLAAGGGEAQPLPSHDEYIGWYDCPTEPGCELSTTVCSVNVVCLLPGHIGGSSPWLMVEDLLNNLSPAWVCQDDNANRVCGEPGEYAKPTCTWNQFYLRTSEGWDPGQTTYVVPQGSLGNFNLGLMCNGIFGAATLGDVRHS